MTTAKKKAAIKKIVKELLKEAHKDAFTKIDKALNSGAIDIDNWSEGEGVYLIPKAITIAIMEDNATTYTPSNTGHERAVKKEVKNIRYFL